MIAVLVPVLRRPHRVAPLMASVAEHTSVPYRLLFIASPGDTEEIAELEWQGADFIVAPFGVAPGDYPRKVNLGYRSTTEPFLFTGADDLEFHPGWDTEALAAMTDGIGVVGTKDLSNPRVTKGEHSTHSLIRRTYADTSAVADQPGAIYCEAYHHEFCDDELVATARHNRAWAFAPNSIVEHLHPDARKAPMDALYAARPARARQGQRLFKQRSHLWGGEPARPTAPVSVIVATYGDESWKKTAERALLSAERQARAPAEVIHVHGSDLASARNEGAEQAVGPWLCFLDADDELHPRFLAAMVPHLGLENAVLNPAVQFVMPGGRKKQPRCFATKDLREGNYLVIGSLVGKEAFFRAGGFDPQWEAWEDWAMWWRVLDGGATVTRVPRAVYRAHWRKDGRNNTVPDQQGLFRRIIDEHDLWLQGVRA